MSGSDACAADIYSIAYTGCSFKNEICRKESSYAESKKTSFRVIPLSGLCWHKCRWKVDIQVNHSGNKKRSGVSCFRVYHKKKARSRAVNRRRGDR